MFILQKLVPADSAPVLNAAVGHHSQIAVDSTNGDIYINLNGSWSKVRTGADAPVAVPLNGALTLKNSSGSITRSLTAVNGVATLAASDTIVSNNDSIPLQKSTGAVASGTATLNSPATAIVAAGAISAVKASA